MTGILKVDEIQNNTGTSAITVDSGGGIRPLNTPIFWVWRSTYYNFSNTPSTLIYDKVDVDNRGAYDTARGRYTIPVAGIYEFGWASIAHSNATCFRYSLAVNGDRDNLGPAHGGVGRIELRLDQNSSGGSEYATNAEFCYYLQCAVGDEVHILGSRDDNASSSGIYSDPNYRYTYFRGKLVA